MTPNQPKDYEQQRKDIHAVVLAGQEPKDWEVQFDEAFPISGKLIYNRDGLYFAPLPSVKDFIHSLLLTERAKEREEIIKLVEGMKIPPQKKEWGSDVPKEEMYNDAFSDLLTRLRSLD